MGHGGEQSLIERIRDFIEDRVGFRSRYLESKIDTYRDIVDPHEAKIFEQVETLHRTRIIGEALFFAGLVVLFFMFSNMPVKPGSLAGFNHSIHIPEILTQNWPYDHPGLMNNTLRDSQIAGRSPSVSTMTTAIMMAGVVSVFLRRWALWGLIVLFFLVPWKMLGIHVSGGPVFAIILINIASLSFLKLPKALRGPAKVLAIIFGPIIFALMAGNASNMVGSKTESTPAAKYQVISYSSLDGKYRDNKYYPLGREPVVTTTLENLKVETSDEIQAKAYVLAQEYAFKGDTIKANENFQKMGDISDQSDLAYAFRADILKSYINANGGGGATIQASIQDEYTSGLGRAKIWQYLGVALLFCFPLSMLVTRQIENTSLTRESDRRTTSLIRMEGALHNELSERSFHLEGKYTYWLIQCAGVVAIMFVMRAIFALPDAISNTAFKDIELVFALQSFGREFGWIGATEQPAIIQDGNKIQMTVMLAGLIFVIVSGKIRYFFIWLLAGMVSNGIVYHPSIANPDYEITMQEMDAPTHAKLEAIVANAKTAPYSEWINQYYGKPGGLVPKFDHIR